MSRDGEEKSTVYISNYEKWLSSDMLSDEEQPEFLADLTEIISENFPRRANGSIILKMPRLFFTAKK